MDRNDRTYFRKITPEYVESLFEGYLVPENIRQRVSLIVRRFTIFGLCDGMYIANTIADENGTGDGHGSFIDAPIEDANVEKIVNALMNAYGCSIFPEDREDLTEIICTGTLSGRRMIAGLQNSIRKRRRDISQIRGKRVVGDTRYANQFGPWYRKLTRDAEKSSDLWRIEFLYGEINVIRDSILMEKAG